MAEGVGILCVGGGGCEGRLEYLWVPGGEQGGGINSCVCGREGCGGMVLQTYTRPLSG